MSYKGFRDEYPREVVDKIYSVSDTTIRNVYRAVIETKEPAPSDFVPYFVSREKESLFIPDFLVPKELDFGKCGMSVFIDLTELKKVVSSSRNTLLAQTKGYAFGRTNIERGMWTSPSPRSHIDYFLFDWENNNPCVDFEILEKINE